MIDSFLIRVYRYNKNRPQDLTGTIQSAESDTSQAFCSLEELWSILAGQITETEEKSPALSPVTDSEDPPKGL